VLDIYKNFVTLIDMNNAFPKLPGKPECMGFRKTITLNLPEHQFLYGLLKSNFHKQGGLNDTMILDIIDKLNAPTPPPN